MSSDVTRQPGFFFSGSQIETRVKKTVLIDVPTATSNALILKTTDDDATKNIFEVKRADNSNILTLNPNGLLELKAPAAIFNLTDTNGGGGSFGFFATASDNVQMAFDAKFTPAGGADATDTSTARFIKNADKLVLRRADGQTPNSTITGELNSWTLDLLTGNTLISGFDASAVGLTIKAASSQTANLQEWQNSSGTALTYIEPDGDIFTSTSYASTAVGAGNLDGFLLYRSVTGSTNASGRARGINFTVNTASNSSMDMTNSSFGGGLIGISAETRHQGEGTVTAMTGLFARVDNTIDGTVTNSRGVWIKPLSSGASATTTNLYGLWVDNVSQASTLNYAIYTNAGIVHMGDKVEFTQTDGNEAIDSLADGYMDYLATTLHRFNNPLTIANIKTGATQVAAGAAADELWATASHATLPDNVVLIGV